MNVNESTLVCNITQDSAIEKIIVASFYWIISSVGLFLQALVITAVYKSQKHKSQLFYLFLTNLCTADCLLFLIYIFVAAPCYLVSDSNLHSNCQIYGNRATFILTQFESIIFIAIVYATFFISVNRALGIILGMNSLSIYSNVFQRIHCNVMIFSCWFGGLVVVIVDYIVTSCGTYFTQNENYFSIQCHHNYYLPSLSLTSIVIYVGLFFICMIYFVTVCQIWNHNKRMRKNVESALEIVTGQTKNLFYQPFCIATSLVINVISKKSCKVHGEECSGVMAHALYFVYCTGHGKYTVYAVTCNN